MTDIEELAEAIELRGPLLRRHFKLGADVDPISAYDLLNSPRVDAAMKQREVTGVPPLSPGRIDHAALRERHDAADRSTQTPRLEQSEPDFAAAARAILSRARKILADDDAEAQYRNWLNEQRALQRLRSDDDSRVNAPDPLNTLNRLRSAARRRLIDGTDERLRVVSSDQERLAELRQAAEDRPSERKPSTLRRLARAATCGLNLHRGDWLRTSPANCHQLLVCTGCGQTLERTEHQMSEPVRLAADACDHVAFCTWCGEESISEAHSWRWQYRGDGCEQIVHCTVCGRSDPGRHRIEHQWGPWQVGEFESTNQRTCRRCQQLDFSGRAETARSTAAEDRPRSDRGIDSGVDQLLPLLERARGVRIAGQWVDSGGNGFVIQQRGKRVMINGATPGGRGGLHGTGRIAGRTVTITFRASDGIGWAGGQAELSLSDDGRTLTGTVRSGPSSQPIELYRA